MEKFVASMKYGCLCWLLLLCLPIVVGETKDSIKIVFGGDMDFSRFVKYLHDKRNCTYKDTLARLKPYVEDADFIIANLETVLKGERTPMLKKVKPKMVNIQSDEIALESLRYIGMSGVTLANNHINDYYDAGINETTRLLNKHDIKYFGVNYGDPYSEQKPLILEKNGIKVGLLGYCDTNEDGNRKQDRSGATLLNTTRTIKEVNKLRKEGCDIIIIFMHWGQEYTQVLGLGAVLTMKSILMEAKVDLFVGAHPHVLHKHWYVNNTLVATSLGNLLATAYPHASMNFQEVWREHEAMSDVIYEKIAYKQSKKIVDATSFGRLLKVEFNKDGIVKRNSTYLNTQISMTKQHCVVTGKKKGARWRRICGEGDPQCIGTASCNFLLCDKKNPFPTTLKSGKYDKTDVKLGV